MFSNCYNGPRVNKEQNNWLQMTAFQCKEKQASNQGEKNKHIQGLKTLAYSDLNK